VRLKKIIKFFWDNKTTQIIKLQRPRRMNAEGEKTKQEEGKE